MQYHSYKPRKALDSRMSYPTKRKTSYGFKPQSRTASVHNSGYANKGTFMLVVMSKLSESFIKEFWDKEEDFNEIKTLSGKHYDEGKTAEESASEIKRSRSNETDKGLGEQDTSEGYSTDSKQHNRIAKWQRWSEKKP